MPAKFAISDEVRSVLKAATIDSRSVKLEGQLDRKRYLEVDKVLKGAGGKWNRGLGVHVFESDPRELLGLAIKTGVATNKKQQFQSFYTPDKLADQVASLAKLGELEAPTVLEPSAGDGALVRAVWRLNPRADVTTIELDPNVAIRVEAMETTKTEKQLLITYGDFLAVKPTPSFDRVVMNPPFTKGQDMKHVRHAFDFLKPDGILVAIVSAMAGQGATKAHKAFSEFLQTYSALISPVEEGAFAESGTNVRTKIICLREACPW